MAAKKKRWSRAKLKKLFHEIMQTQTSSHAIALGFSVGTLIAVLFTFGLDVILGGLVVLVYRKINKLALFGALALWNPVVMVPVYITSYKVGNVLLGPATAERSIGLIYQVYDSTLRFAVGNIALAVVISVFSYFLVRGIASTYRSRKRKG